MLNNFVMLSGSNLILVLLQFWRVSLKPLPQNQYIKLSSQGKAYSVGLTNDTF